MAGKATLRRKSAVVRDQGSRSYTEFVRIKHWLGGVGYIIVGKVEDCMEGRIGLL